jgi:peptide/nickel transport system ATP-binding protein
MVFQDPLGSLHPRHTINNILKEPLEIHNFIDIEDRIKQVLNKVGFGFKFSVQVSPSAFWRSTSTSGNWQSVNSGAWHITARRTNIRLDVSVQAEILNLLMDLQESVNLT